MKMHQNNALQPIDRHQWCLIRDHPPLPTICPYCSIAITRITMISMINHHDHGKFKDGDVFFGHLSAPVINCALFFYKSYSNQPAWYQYFGKLPLSSFLGQRALLDKYVIYGRRCPLPSCFRSL